jgi:endonuclease/exonuclease/phosphatase family metal-dependent hydrolase
VHLSPAGSDFRLKEANIIIEKITDNKSDKYIILGDFNAHSPFDEELLRNNKDLIKKYGKDKPNESANLRLGEFDYSVISKFIALPTIDISIKFIDIADRYTFPSPVLIGSWRKNKEEVIQTRERIDYIFTSPIISKSCANVTIYNKGEAETFSDHYPIMAEFNFETKK